MVLGGVGSKVVAKCWTDTIEESATEQILNLCTLPFAFSHIAIMPDVHCGYGMPIGAVLATHDVIIPNAVGVDIGCGMCAVQTGIHINDFPVEKIKQVMGGIRKAVPVGFGHRQSAVDSEWMPKMPGVKVPIIEDQYKSARKQLGTLGGGNHFLELQKDQEDMVWIMIHSGSRNLGKQVADHYNDIAVALNEKWHSVVLKEHQLAFLPVDSDEGRSYLAEMQYCVDFALASRQFMMNEVIEILADVMGSCGVQERINIAHNYASLESHFGQNVYVHRKGATSAKKDEIGIIPGSQGTASYIVKGKGNRDSFMSCSHGAGRKMGRNVARKTLNLEDEINLLDSIGVVHGIRTQDDLDEAPSAYKDIDVVMANQKDLVEIQTKLTPIAVIKG